ncbi:MAG TPA: hypothetical protein VFE54_13085 [Mucilaginibacter sp.]|nr:hypothetical protein [Mucilaginibacter sp.]
MKQAMQLRLSYNLILPHPFAQESSSQFELWAEYRLEVVDANGRIIKTVLEIEWDLLMFLSWFVENKNALLEQGIPLENKYSSIGEAVYHFYDAMDDDFDNDELLDGVYEYRVAHGIRFALRGTDIPDIYIGIFNKNGTISFCDNNEKWNYNINLADFLEKTVQAYDLLIAIKMMNMTRIKDQNQRE